MGAGVLRLVADGLAEHLLRLLVVLRFVQFDAAVHLGDGGDGQHEDGEDALFHIDKTL